jgi:hypothetical protein
MNPPDTFTPQIIALVADQMPLRSAILLYLSIYLRKTVGGRAEFDGIIIFLEFE